MTVMDLSRAAPARQWQSMSLATQYAIASSLVLIMAALAIGSWVTERIEDSVVRNSANATAIYMESFISPISQQLATGEALSPGAQRALEELLANTALGQRVVSYKFWRNDGYLIDASNKEIVGQTFPLTDNLRRAWAGQVTADFDDLSGAEDLSEAALDMPLLEIYSPIREVWSGEVIAVAELYEVNHELHADLIAARRAAWFTVLAIMLGLGSLLYIIVLGGSRLIDRQRRDLDARMADLTEMSARNEDLRRRVQSAAARAAAQTEQSMRRIGADLHDGPAQYPAYAALRLDNLRDHMETPAANGELDTVAVAITDAMTEVRALSRGLSLPDIADRPLPDILRGAVDAHVVRTGHEVAITISCDTPPALSPAERICVFRFLQEGLSNASRHAGGVGLAVTLTCTTQQLTLTLRDRGPGLETLTVTDLPGETAAEHGLGLAGLRDRVESLGGTFVARTHPLGGTELCMTLDAGADR